MAIARGLTVSVNNTPQSQDDSLAASTADVTLINIARDLMANDLGGGAKTFYGIDQTNVQNDWRTTTTVRSAQGATVSLQIVNGAVTDIKYDTSTSGRLQALPEGAAGTDTFTYTIRLSSGALSTATVTLSLVGTNDAPVVRGVVAGTATEDGAKVSLNALANASDVDTGAVMSVTNLPAKLPDGVTFDAASQQFILDPAHPSYQSLAAGQTQVVTVNYGVTDGKLSAPASVSWTVTGTNDAARIGGTTQQTVAETNAALTTGGQLTVTDVDGAAAFRVQQGVAGQHGKFSVDASGAWTYTANEAHDRLPAGESLTDTFSVEAADGTRQDVTVTITGTNDAAVIGGTSQQTVAETNAALTTGGQLTVSDVDGSAAFQAQPDIAGQHGKFSIAADGTWTYAANGANDDLAEGQQRIDSVKVRAADGTEQTLQVTITGTNDAAVIGGDVARTADETNEAVTATGRLSVADVDGAAAFVAQNGTRGQHGTFSIETNGAWTYTASQAYDRLAAGQTLVDTFTVVAADGTPQQVAVTIRGTNDAPTLSIADGSASLTEGNGRATLGASGALTAADVDAGDAIGLSARPSGEVTWSGGTLDASLAEALRGGFTVGQDGWRYATSENLDFLAEGQTLTLSYDVVATDAAGASSAPQKVSITITGTNDAAVISGDVARTVAEAGGIDNATGGTPAGVVAGQLLAADPDGADDAFRPVAPTEGAYGRFAMDAAGAWTYTLDNAKPAVQALRTPEDTLVETFEVQSADGTPQTLTVTVTGTNDAPTLSVATTRASLTEGDGAAALRAEGALSFADVDAGDRITVSARPNGDMTWSGGQLGAEAVAAISRGFVAGQDGWTYGTSENLDFLGAGQTLTFSYDVVATDAAGASSAPQTVTVTITGTNDAAVIGGDVARTVDETNEAVSASGRLTVTDVDGEDAFAAQQGRAGQHGTFSIDADGAWTYTANEAYDRLAAGQTLTDTFSVESADGTERQVAVTIRGTNDAPVVSGAASVDAQEGGGAVRLGALDNVTDVDTAGAALRVVAPQSMPAGVTYDEATRSFALDTSNAAYQSLAAGAPLAVSVEYGVSDGTATVAARATWNLVGTNDAPVVAGALTARVAEGSADKLALDLLQGASDIDRGDTLGVSGVTYKVGDAEASGTAPAGVALSGNVLTVDAAHQAFDRLGEGESVDIVVRYTVGDGQGGQVAQSQTITVTGTNDLPTIAAGRTSATGAVAEIADRAAGENSVTHAASGTIAFDDADLGDTHAASVAAQGADYLGNFSLGAVDQSGNALGWSFSVADAALDSLAAGQTRVQRYDVSVDDGHGGKASRTVEVTITGTNDQPTIQTTTTATGSVSEIAYGTAGENTFTHAAQGSIAFDDADLTDLHTVSVKPQAEGYLGQFAVGEVDQSGHALGWKFSASDAALNGLAAGERRTQSYDVSISDGRGGVVTQTVQVELVGAADAPANLAPTDIVFTANPPSGNGLPNPIGYFSTVDPDAASNDRPTYSLSQGSGPSTLGLVAASTNGPINVLSGNLTEGTYAFSVSTVDARGGSYSEDFRIIVGSNNNQGSESLGTNTSPPVLVDEVIYGRQGTDILYGNGGNDVLFGQGGADQLLGGAGNDILYFDGNDTRYDGGMGSDTLRSEVAVSLAAQQFRVMSGIEHIDLTNNNRDTVTLTADDVLTRSDGRELRISGNEGDSVTSTGQGWQAGNNVTLEGQVYASYTSVSGATLLIELDVNRLSTIS